MTGRARRWAVLSAVAALLAGVLLPGGSARAIVDGTEVTAKEYTDRKLGAIALLYEAGGTPNGNIFCNGVLIGPAWVLTAAHCVYKRKLDDFRVNLGSRTTFRQDPGAETHEVVGMYWQTRYVHSDDGTKTSVGDLALLRLGTASKQAPLRISDTGGALDAEAYIYSFGPENPVNPFGLMASGVLRKAKYLIRPIKRCGAPIGIDCYEQAGRGTAFGGDSGAPYLIEGPSGLEIAGIHMASLFVNDIRSGFIKATSMRLNRSWIDGCRGDCHYATVTRSTGKGKVLYNQLEADVDRYRFEFLQKSADVKATTTGKAKVVIDIDYSTTTFAIDAAQQTWPARLTMPDSSTDIFSCRTRGKPPADPLGLLRELATCRGVIVADPTGVNVVAIPFRAKLKPGKAPNVPYPFESNWRLLAYTEDGQEDPSGGVALSGYGGILCDPLDPCLPLPDPPTTCADLTDPDCPPPPPGEPSPPPAPPPGEPCDYFVVGPDGTLVPACGGPTPSPGIPVTP